VIDLDAVRRLCDQATLGPWDITRDLDDVENTTIRAAAAWFVEYGHRQYGVRPIAQLAEGNLNEADAEFIAAARELVPRMAVELEQARADILALLPAAQLYLKALDDDPEHEYLTLPEAILVTALREAVARHTADAEDGAR
jgi:hypothetical protein